MKGHVILSHGMESGPNATKVAALAEVAEQLGWRHTRPDYRDLDAAHDPALIGARIARLREHAREGERLVLAGSSMGAFISGFASLDLPCAGLFLMALPLRIPGYAPGFVAAAVPSVLLHGWDDELCPVDGVRAFAASRRDTLILVNDSHRLSAHVHAVAEQFRLFLLSLG